MKRLSRVVFVAKSIAESGLTPPSFFLLEIRMRLHRSRNGGENFREVPVAIEQQDGCLRVSPGKITKKLIDGLSQLGRAAPKFALRNEDVPIA
jgi:hypothetical protein